MKIIAALVILCSPFCILGQQTITASITHGGLQREYILYVPEIYNPDQAAPLILNYHGYTSNALAQFLYSDFRPVADTAGFLIVHPQGTIDQLGNPHWNVGWGFSFVDDVGFTAALIDSLSTQFTIDHDRVYSTGMSNGGFFSFKLACELSERIAAIASVTGSMNKNQPALCAPEHAMPVMQIHGTADPTVIYGENIFFESINTVISYWKNFNQTNAIADTIHITDTDTTDGCTAEHYIYDQGTKGVTVEHFKIIGGQHTWPGSEFGGVGTNQDIHASREIWRFFSRYDLQSLMNSTSTNMLNPSSSITLYPNPSSAFIKIQGDISQEATYRIVDLMGRHVMSGIYSPPTAVIDISAFHSGIYLLLLNTQAYKFVKQ